MRQEAAQLSTRLLWATLGLAGILTGMVMMVNLLLSTPVRGQTVEPTLAASGQAPQARIVNGRSVYAVPIVTGPAATAILQYIAPNGIAYVVHSFDGWGKSTSTAVGWFRCGDILSPNQYNGTQVEIERWALLTEQERTEAQAACSF